MWNCSAVLTRNGSLYNSTINLATKDRYLQKCTSSIFTKRLFKTYLLSIEEQSDITKFKRCILNKQINQQCKYTNVNPASINSLSIKKFHTCLTTNYAEDINDRIQVKLSHGSTDKNSNIKYQSLFNHSVNIENDPFDHVTESTDISDTSTSSNNRQYVKSHSISFKDIERMYPKPKEKIHHIVQLINANMNEENPITYHFARSNETHSWTCTLKVIWPESMSFTGQSKNKLLASNVACWKYLHYLETNKKLKNGSPILFDNNTIEKLREPVKISVKKETLDAAKIILDKYEEDIQSIIESCNTSSIQPYRFQDGAIMDPVGTSNPANRHQEKINRRNELLQSRFEHRKSQGYSVDLPIREFREQIINEIEKNNVLVIKGDTGCGKTTQVPQYIMDSFAERGRATDCNMIVSQPRRISAISLAERIADEREERVGDVVGYQVRLSQELPNTPAGILFCTSGILLRKLQFNPTLEGCTHVIVDEAHERTINTDMLLVLLKRALQQKPMLKVIIMSATINAELFQNYFNCNVIEIPGRTFPVEMHFLNDIEKLDLPCTNKWDLSFKEMKKETGGPITDVIKMAELISWISRTKPPGGILCFLPGWAEIVKLKKYLEEFTYISRNKMLILPVHSKMSHMDQKKIFSKPPPNVRKIVLATDIAETGITVADVVYVIDSCTHRQVQWHERRALSSIENQWASQANINQRKGRAGRVRPGESYHLITREKFEELDAYPAPEVMRSSLEKTVLDAKTYSHEKALDFLGSMPQPPAPSVIRQAIQDLIDLGALDHNENLTPLGKRISLFTLNPQLSKAIVYSSIFQCVSPLLTIASVMSGESEIFSGVLYNKTAIRNIKSTFHPSSDHIGIAWLFQQWNAFNRISRENARNFAYKSELVPEKVYTLSKVREINAEHLYHAKMLPSLEVLDDMSAKENEYAELDELCRGVLLAGLDQVLFQRNYDFRKGLLKKGAHTFIMEDGTRATITPESLNFKRKQWPSPFITYVRRTHSEERRTSLIRETSIISPLTVFLFSQTRILGYLNDPNNNDNRNYNENNNNNNNEIIFTMKGRKNVKLICDKTTADVLLNFRDAMWSVVRYLVAKTGEDNQHNDLEFEQVQAFKVQMLQVLGKMLSEASEKIDGVETRKNNYQEADESDDDY